MAVSPEPRTPTTCQPPQPAHTPEQGEASPGCAPSPAGRSLPPPAPPSRSGSPWPTTTPGSAARRHGTGTSQATVTSSGRRHRRPSEQRLVRRVRSAAGTHRQHRRHVDPDRQLHVAHRHLGIATPSGRSSTSVHIGGVGRRPPTRRAGADHPLLPSHRHDGHRRRAGCRRRRRRRRTCWLPSSRPSTSPAAGSAPTPSCRWCTPRPGDRCRSASCSSRPSRWRCTRPSAREVPSTPPSATPSPPSATTPTWTRCGPAGRPAAGARAGGGLPARAARSRDPHRAHPARCPPRPRFDGQGAWRPTGPPPASPADRERRARQPRWRRRRRRPAARRRLGHRHRPRVVDPGRAGRPGGGHHARRPGQLGHLGPGLEGGRPRTSITSSIPGPGTASSPTGSWSRPPAPAASRPTS